MNDTDALIEELLAYRRITNDRGTDTYTAAAGSHDDLVLALSLALWLTENRPIRDPNLPAISTPQGDIPGIVTMGEGLLW
jgi:hypothetical protein